MCGFLLSYDPTGESDVDAALDILTHRGPDDRGIHRDGALTLGFRRLSILDLSPAGHQPMVLDSDALLDSGEHSAKTERTGEASWGEPLALVFNGEIYSFREHRRELEAAGIPLRSSGDTEILARMLQRHGVDALPRLNGMFAFAAWSPARRELLLARDRLGIKPLYYVVDGPRFAAASELKALLALPFVRREIDPEAARGYFSFGYVPGEPSIVRGVQRLAPGAFLRVRLGEERPSLKPGRYWDLPDPSEPTQPIDLEALAGLVRDAVRLRTVADVPLLSFLSGGIDSTLVTTCLSELDDRRARAFTIAFPDGIDEAEAAATTAGLLGAEHHREALTPRHGEILDAFVETYDEPFGDSSALPTLLLCRGARRHATVALSGDGGDELFAGYDRYVKTLRLQRFLGPVPAPLARFLGRVLERSTGRWSRWNRLAWWLRQTSSQHYLDQAMTLHPRHWEGQPAALEELAACVLDAPPEGAAWQDRLRWMQSFDLRRYLADDILVKVDRASMRYSLEVRVPLLDHRIVELAFRAPRERMIVDGERKWPLREAFRSRLPRHVLDGPKRGFGIPADRWLHGPWKDDVLAAFDSHRDASHRVLSSEMLHLLRRGFEDGVPEADKAAWMVLVFERWARRWLGSGSSA